MRAKRRHAGEGWRGAWERHTIAKRDEPPMHATMNVANIMPNGGEMKEETESLIAGVQLKTNIYIEPSKRETTCLEGKCGMGHNEELAHAGLRIDRQ